MKISFCGKSKQKMRSKTERYMYGDVTPDLHAEYLPEHSSVNTWMMLDTS